MWRPCVWPPEADINTINCSGGKMVAYVYHMFKEHWCGDDFEYENDMWAATYRTQKTPQVNVSFFQPNPEEWYTIWSHVKMNSAGEHHRYCFSRLMCTGKCLMRSAFLRLQVRDQNL